MPLPIVLALLGLLISAVAYGFGGPPARRPRPVLTILLLGLGLLTLPFGAGALAVRHPDVGLLVVTLGVLLFALAAHLLRASGGGGGEDDGGGPEGGGPPRPRDPGHDPGGLPVDWDAFDRERAGWTGEQPLTPTR